MFLLLSFLATSPGISSAHAEDVVVDATDAAAVHKRADVLWLQRDWGGHTDEAIELLKAADKANPGDFETNWQLARFYYVKANTKSGDTKATLGKKGWDHAEAAKKLNPGAVEGYYWTSACAGAYGNGAGIMTALKDGVGDVFVENAEKAISIDADHDDGGPYRALGRFYVSTPWPVGDLDKAIELLEKANASEPNSAVNAYFLADAYHEDGNDTKAKEWATKAAGMDPKTNGDPPGVRKNVKLAEQLLAEI
ncbi:MAG: tetratricopeptide repeat protein [Proteobacteria bacterium]|nr:tetratricopeptide repeat protein [Pseudomonadota bacterium]MCP4915860.1 tetratricopeptide repeat protein [Pseudomonadota bacterium]